MVEPRDDPAQIADPVAVGVRERARIDLVQDAVAATTSMAAQDTNRAARSSIDARPGTDSMEPVPRERGTRGLATIAEVAGQAGVGVATVSRVINGSPAVREQTRQRVLDAIAELGYAPNPAARALSTGRTSSVGVVAPFFTRPSVIERLRGMSRAWPTRATGVLFDVERPGQDARFLRLAVGRRSTACSWSRCCPSDTDFDGFAHGRHAGGARRPPARAPDRRAHRRRGRRAAGHRSPARLGHERIAFLGEFERRRPRVHLESEAAPRLQKARYAAGLEVAPGARASSPHGRELRRGRGARAARRGRAADGGVRRLRPAGDRRARGRRRAGVDVPGRLAVIGYDDVEIARYAG